MITLHVQPVGQEGPPIQIDCPACGHKAVNAIPFESVDQVKLAYLIPLMKLRSTWVTCGHCNQQIACTAPMAQLEGQDSQSMQSLLRYHATGGARTLSLIAFLLSWVPLLGLILISVAMFHTRGTRGLARSLCVFGVIIAITCTVLTGLMFVPIR